MTPRLSLWLLALLVLVASGCHSNPEAGWKDLRPDLAATPSAPSDPRFPLSDQKNGGGWTPIPQLSDEFNGNRIDDSKWLNYSPHWLGSEPGWFNPANTTEKGGLLRLRVTPGAPPQNFSYPDNTEIRGKRWIGTAVLESNTTTLYGYYEVRAKIADSRACSAFWFFKKEPDQWTEIDVFEAGPKNPSYSDMIHIDNHVFYTPKVKKAFEIAGEVDMPSNPSGAFHVYGVDWEANLCSYYIDGKLVRTGPNEYWHQPLNILLSTGILQNWFGVPNASELPTDFQVDYIRSWRHRA